MPTELLNDGFMGKTENSKFFTKLKKVVNIATKVNSESMVSITSALESLRHMPYHEYEDSLDLVVKLWLEVK